MSAKPRQGGVRTIGDMMDRCYVDDITGCWIWGLVNNSNQAPTLFYPPLDRVVSLGVAIGHLLTGKAAAPGVVWHCICETRQCANPDHRKAGTRSTQMLAAGLKRSPQTKARITAAKRLSSKLTDADVSEIRGSEMKLTEIMERYGISQGYACDVRSGKRRVPLAAPGSSVFAWRPS